MQSSGSRASLSEINVNPLLVASLSILSKATASSAPLEIVGSHTECLPYPSPNFVSVSI
jgi:hypothetical protein